MWQGRRPEQASAQFRHESASTPELRKLVRPTSLRRRWLRVKRAAVVFWRSVIHNGAVDRSGPGPSYGAPRVLPAVSSLQHIPCSGPHGRVPVKNIEQSRRNFLKVVAGASAGLALADKLQDVAPACPSR